MRDLDYEQNCIYEQGRIDGLKEAAGEKVTYPVGFDYEQNCIYEEARQDARQEARNLRPCNCGSGEPWTTCGAQSPYCG